MRDSYPQVLNVKLLWKCHQNDHGHQQGQQDSPLNICINYDTAPHCLTILLTSDDMDLDPVGGGVGGDTGVVATVLRSALPHCQPTLQSNILHH